MCLQGRIREEIGIILFVSNDARFFAHHRLTLAKAVRQQGYKVVFVAFKGDKPANKHWQDFADGFKGKRILHSPSNARYRPVGLAQGPHGALYISDDQRGRIWKVVYTGSK